MLTVLRSRALPPLLSASLSSPSSFWGGTPLPLLFYILLEKVFVSLQMFFSPLLFPSRAIEESFLQIPPPPVSTNLLPHDFLFSRIRALVSLLAGRKNLSFFSAFLFKILPPTLIFFLSKPVPFFAPPLTKFFLPTRREYLLCPPFLPLKH